MPEEKPVVYILRGDDREKIESLLRQFQDQLGSADLAEMNITQFDGRSTDLNDLRSAALALPFLTERRLVILDDALAKFAKGESRSGDTRTNTRDEFLSFLDSLPPTTALVLVIPDQKKSRTRNGVWETDWEKLNTKHWLMQWMAGAGPRAVVVDCGLPTDREMARWVEQKAQQLGGGFEPQARMVLADYVGNDTQRAAQEIIKLLTFVNFERLVTVVDVETLCVSEKQADIYAMVDAIGKRDGKTASRLFHLLLEEMDFTYQLFPAIVRQFRFLIQAREILDQGGTQADLKAIPGLLPFLVSKIYEQVQNFNLSTLETIYQRLLKIDLGEKTGRMRGDVAMDILIAWLAS
jgi:DNA polymerase III subunit delta